MSVVNETLHREYVDVESDKFSDSIYGQRMINYYPQVISCIQEFRAIIRSDYPEFEQLNSSSEDVIEDAYLLTMNEDRIIQWEKILGIKPIANSTIDDRRETIVARIRGQGKLNTALINSIVNAFTGGTANSWVANSTLYVEITPPPNNKQFQFANVEQEIGKKIPAHLNYQVSRNYYTWGDINNNFATWSEMQADLPYWEDVYLYTPFA